MTDSKLTSIEIGRAALKIAVTGSRSEEQRIKQELAEQGFLVIAGKVPRCYIGSTFVYVAREVCVYSVWDFIYYYRVLGVKG